MKKIWEKLKKRYVNKKNLVRIIVTDIIVINLIFAAMGFFLYLMLRKDTISELMPEHIEKVEITYEYTRCIELAEPSDMPIDE